MDFFIYTNTHGESVIKHRKNVTEIAQKIIIMFQKSKNLILT